MKGAAVETPATVDNASHDVPAQPAESAPSFPTAAAAPGASTLTTAPATERRRKPSTSMRHLGVMEGDAKTDLSRQLGRLVRDGGKNGLRNVTSTPHSMLMQAQLMPTT